MTKIKLDLHTHTKYSKDSWTSIKSLIKTVQASHLDGLAITDHDTIKGALALKKANPPFKVIIGEEITTDQGQIIGYFLQEEIKPGLPVEKTIQLIREQGGLVSVPHPFDRLRHGVIKRRALRKIINQIDLIETYNSRNIWPGAEKKARSLAQLMDISQIAGSDGHTKFELGNSFVEIEDFENATDFMKNIKSAKLVHSHSPFLFYLISGLARLKNTALRPIK